MAKQFLCVEVGNRLVKVSVAQGTEKKRKVKDAFFFEASDDLVSDGYIRDASRFATTLSTTLGNHKLGEVKEIFFTVASTKVVTREVRMPVITDPKIESVVENNKNSYFPMETSELEEHKVMFRVMSRDKKGADKGANVLVLAMPNEMISACASVANNLGMRIRGVDAACSSLADGVAVLKQAQITAYINVEASSTNLCFMKGNELLLQRSLSFGGEELIRAYMNAKEEVENQQLTYLEALNDLSGISAEENVHGKLEDDEISDHLERVVGSIARSVEFFNNNKGGGVHQIVLMGTCGELLGIEEMLEDGTGISTMHMSQLSTASQLRSISQTPAYYVSMMYAGASGLNFGAEFDPKNQKGKRSSGKQELDLPTTILIFLLMSLFAGYWAYVPIMEKAAKEKELQTLKDQIAAMEYLDKVSALHSSFQLSKDTLLNFTANTANPNENLVAFLSELEAKMPSEILVLSATCTSTTVSMNLIVNSLVEAATVVSKLRSFESIANISVSGLAMNTVQFEGEEYSQAMQDGFEEVAFSVVCTYGTNPYVSGINPYAGVLGIEALPSGGNVETPVA